MTTTWNPADKGSGITLSGGNLTAATSGSGSVRSTTSKSSGKWYVEFTVVADATSNDRPGIADSTFDVSAGNFGGDAHGVAALIDFGIFQSNSDLLAMPPPTINVGDVVGISVDLDGLVFGVNVNGGTFVTTTFTALTGATFMCWSGSSSTTAKVTTNFGGSAFAFTPPSGYTGWDVGVVAAAPYLWAGSAM